MAAASGSRSEHLSRQAAEQDGLLPQEVSRPELLVELPPEHLSLIGCSDPFPGAPCAWRVSPGSSALISRELGEAEALTPEPSLRLTKLRRFGAISMEAVSTTTHLICANVA